VIIVPKADAVIEQWVEQQMRLQRAGLDAPEKQKDAPEKFIRAIEGGGNFGLQAEYDAGIQRLRAVAANTGWSPSQSVVIVVTPAGSGQAGHVNDYLLSREDVALIESALRSRVADYRRARQ
jgi:hypothetical protein